MKMKSSTIIDISPEVFFTLHDVKDDPTTELPTLLPEGSPQILKYLRTIGKLLLIVPTWSGRNAQNSASRSQWLGYIHKAACGVTTILAVTLMTFTVFSMCRGNLNQLSSDTSGLFVCFELISFLYLVIVIYATGWRLGPKLETLLQNKKDCEHTEQNVNLRNWRKLLLSPQSGWILASTLYSMNRIAEFADSAITSHGYFQKFSGRFYQHALFFLSTETKELLWHPYLNILCIVAFTSSRIVRMYGTIMVFAVITVHDCAVREFTGHSNQFGSLAAFRQQFASLQDQVDEVNGLMGRVVLGFTLHLFPMYMMWSTDLFYDSYKEGKAREKMAFFIYFFLYAIFYRIAANNYQKVVSTVEETVLRNRERWNLDSGEFSSYLYRARHSELGVSGGGFFTISHKSIASVLSFMLTYTIVLIQLKSNRSGYDVNNKLQ